ncbi:hypothetical protein SAMN05216553_103417 [Lentzea fradiae]|uniref:Polymorphic outer membrane protein repeat-containing protein n=1 Tax=Lentzea fradiae TaxID=200378 RepID=A0A1G7P823_9PSEU|nr:hypothetical protein [Lentzea fradiae]SDF81590.1 hypothetical protein SAMN05216553_103417 [Lentzea fradiae]
MSGRQVVVLLAALVAGCGTTVQGSPVAAPPPPPSPSRTVTVVTPPSSTSSAAPTTTTPPPPPPVAKFGNPDGTAAVPPEAAEEDTSKPTRVIGTGTPASCTSQAVVDAVAAGGVITFDCGPAPLTIPMAATAKVRTSSGPKVVIDGGGLVTLSGQGQRRVLYQNTCDRALGITTSHCQDQDAPKLVVQNITLADGNSTGDETEGGGGGALFVRGGQLKVVNARFSGNKCDATGPDLGGAAIRVLDQFRDGPVHVTGSTFEGGVCSNGGALSSIGTSWVVLNSLFRGNKAVGRGANPARDGTPGGGSGGAIYNDGNKFTLRIAGSLVEDNQANEGGGAVFFVSNDRSGSMSVQGSTLRRNPSLGFETVKGIFYLGAGAKPEVTASTIR